MEDSKQDLLKAWKNGICQYFTRRQWEVMGSDKYGWVLEPEVPKEVRDAELIKSAEQFSNLVASSAETIKEAWDERKTRAPRKSKEQ